MVVHTLGLDPEHPENLGRRNSPCRFIDDLAECCRRPEQCNPEQSKDVSSSHEFRPPTNRGYRMAQGHVIEVIRPLTIVMDVIGVVQTASTPVSLEIIVPLLVGMIVRLVPATRFAPPDINGRSRVPVLSHTAATEAAQEKI